jgi:hypothetical protein
MVADIQLYTFVATHRNVYYKEWILLKLYVNSLKVNEYTI